MSTPGDPSELRGILLRALDDAYSGLEIAVLEFDGHLIASLREYWAS